MQVGPCEKFFGRMHLIFFVMTSVLLSECLKRRVIVSYKQRNVCVKISLVLPLVTFCIKPCTCTLVTPNICSAHRHVMYLLKKPHVTLHHFS